ncbi:MAG: hypothetical protein NC347_13380 [Clostridium sp.]|nr:hypothetical protein [Clostridium sp.]
MASRNRLDQAAGASVNKFISSADENKPEPEQTTRKRTEKRQQDIDAFLELLRQGKNQTEASEAVGHEKTWASHVIAELKEKEPERLKGTPQEVKDTPQTTQKPQTAPEPPQTEIPTPAEEKAEEKANTRAEKQTFSFRAEQSKIENWKLYAETIGTKDIGTLWTAAIDEYISNHELTADQQAVYDLKKKAAEIQRNQK